MLRMSLLPSKVTKTAAAGRQRTPPDNAPQGRCCVALPCADPHTPRLFICSNGATIHIVYEKGLRPFVPLPRNILDATRFPSPCPIPLSSLLW